jgi:methylmalonyl-CoA epimerase
VVKSFFSVNIAVNDLKEAVPKYEALLEVKAQYHSDPKYQAFPGMDCAILNPNGVLIILITTSDENHPVGKFLKQKGEGIFLLSVEVGDIDTYIEQLKAKGMKFVLPACAEGGYGKVNFIHPKFMNGVQWEVLQPEGILKK